MNLNEMIEQRTKLITDAQKIVLQDNVTSEHRAQANKMLVDVEALEADIALVQKIAKLEAETRATVRPSRGNIGAVETTEKDATELRNFAHYMRTGEKRDITTTSGGSIIPQQFLPTIYEAQKLVGNTLSIVGKKVTNNNGAPIKVGYANDTANTLVTMTGEATAVGEVDPTFGGFILNTDTVSTMIKISIQELEDAAFDFGSWIKTAFATRFYRGLETILTNGNTYNVASIVTGATLANTTAANTGPTFADFTACYSHLDPAYEANASWVMSSTTRAYVMGLTDTLGRPLFIPNPSSGVVDHILGRPIVLNQLLPAANVAANTGVLYGDFEQGYILRTDGDLNIRRLDERFADTLEVGFLAYARVGGASTDAGTHPILKMATHA